MKIVFLVEEPSMDELLQGILPKILPSTLKFQIIPHQGKTDLESSIPKKLRGWREPDVRFVVLRDNDSGDCKKLKRKLVRMCSEAGRPDTLVRIVCQELESWLLGDLNALSVAYNEPKIRDQEKKAKFREPDKLSNASEELKN
jgi:hypothetical protein